MNAQVYSQKIKEAYDAFNARDFDAFLGMLSEGADLDLVPFEKQFHGKSEIKQALKLWLGTFPDMKLKVVSIAVSDRGGVAEIIAKGTQNGDLNLPGGSLGPTGKAVEIKGCEVFQFENEKCTSVHSYYDTGSILRQLGINQKKAAA